MLKSCFRVQNRHSARVTGKFVYPLELRTQFRIISGAFLLPGVQLTDCEGFEAKFVQRKDLVGKRRAIDATARGVMCCLI
jgi:hypothetical protein